MIPVWKSRFTDCGVVILVSVLAPFVGSAAVTPRPASTLCNAGKSNNDKVSVVVAS